MKKYEKKKHGFPDDAPHGYTHHVTMLQFVNANILNKLPHKLKVLSQA
jgi:hypothetical protein